MVTPRAYKISHVKCRLNYAYFSWLILGFKYNKLKGLLKLIIEYKNELIHEHTAISCIKEFLFAACDTLESGTTVSEIKDFDLPIGVILQSIANAHKLDHIRLTKNKLSKQFQILKISNKVFKKRHKDAVALYQTADPNKSIDGIKPHQFIHDFLVNSKSSTPKQSQIAQQVVKNLDEAFELCNVELHLSVGQRLYRGMSLTESDIEEMIDASERQTPIKHQNYMSTSLSESVAKVFSAISYLGNLQKNPDGIEMTDVVLVLTNRRKNLAFIMPDALRKPNYNQGQMEILLPRNLQILPTHFELNEFDAKIYVDIL